MEESKDNFKMMGKGHPRITDLNRSRGQLVENRERGQRAPQ